MEATTTDRPALSAEALQRFCATENDIRYYLQSPWREAGSICATNGHICIEIPADGRVLTGKAIGSGIKMPSVSKLLARAPIGAFVPMPALVPAAEAGQCRRCKGVGTHGEVACEECDGSGEIEHGRHKYTCAECNGIGYIGQNVKQVVCLGCDGFGEELSVGRTHKTVIDKAHFATRYLRAFASLPGVEISVGGPTDMAHIRFHGGRGGVMPIRQD